MNLLLTLIIAALAATSSFLPSTGKVFDNRSGVVKGLSYKGWWTLGLLLALILVTAIQNWLNQKETADKEITVKNEQHIRDSIQKRNYDSSLVVMKKKTDSSNLNLFKALAEYGLRADSSNKRLVKIVRDSSKTRVLVADDPVLGFCGNNGITLEENKTISQSRKYRVNICSNDAGSTDFNISFQLAILDTLNRLHYIGDSYFLKNDTQISKNSSISSSFNYTSAVIYNTLYVYAKGAYRNLDKTKSFSINEVYYYNLKNKVFEGALLQKDRGPLIKLFGSSQPE